MVRRVLFWFVTAVVLLIVIGPLVWIYLTAFKSPGDIFTTELKKLIVFAPTLGNFNRLFTDFPFWFNLGNTAIMSVVSTIFVMLVSIAGGL